MNDEAYRELTDGYEAALEAIPELAEILAETEESMVDALSELTGELQTLTCTLRLCLKAVRQAGEKGTRISAFPVKDVGEASDILRFT